MYRSAPLPSCAHALEWGRGPVATLSEVQSQVFDASCTGCHSGSSPSQGVNLSEGAAYGNTVNVPSTEVPSLNLVEPNDADNSYLMQKLEGTAQSGQQMPYGALI
ncbi:MAG: hypothetical protein CM1200mP9_05930 [Gammaproteobacteria bacterium]|nr:MAG: hypothetical protein CM1200mP9_05930 [Gammaproteobacteria bacterium]